MVLCESCYPLVELSTEMELGWRNDLLEAKYNSSGEERYFALFTQIGDIRPSFKPLASEVRLALLNAAYKFKIFS